MSTPPETRSKTGVIALVAALLVIGSGVVAVGLLVVVAGAGGALYLLADEAAVVPAEGLAIPADPPAVVAAPAPPAPEVEDPEGASEDTGTEPDVADDAEPEELPEPEAAPPSPRPAPRPRPRPAPPKPAPAPAADTVTVLIEVAQSDAYVEIAGRKVSGPVQLEPGHHKIDIGRGVEGRRFSVTVAEDEANTWCYDFDAVQRVREGRCSR